MKTNLPNLFRFALVAGLLAATVSFAHDGKEHSSKAPAAAGQLVEPTDQDAGWLAKARAAYPFKTCVVSDDELGGDMGEVVDRIYREKGKPDRLIRFCCDGCLEDFAKDPAGFLRKLEKPVEPKPGDSHHKH